MNFKNENITLYAVDDTGLRLLLHRETNRTIETQPHTGVSCTIQSRNSVKFKPGKTLRKQLNDTNQP